MNQTAPQTAQAQSHEEWAPEEIARRRARAYADPVTGSDRYFAEALRLDAEGDSLGASAARERGCARHDEIRAEIAGTSAPSAAPQGFTPKIVTMRQARLALHAAGLLAAVAPAIVDLPEPDRTAAEIEWEYAQEVRREIPLTAMLGAALGLDDAALDALFVQAGGL